MQPNVAKVDKTRYMSLTEAQKALAYADTLAMSHRHSDRLTEAVIKLALYTGCRASELVKLDIIHIAFDRQGIVVSRLKRRKPVAELVAMPPALEACLKRFIGHLEAKGNDIGPSAPLLQGKRGRLTRKGIWQCWCKALKKSGLPRYPIHAARHTVAMNLYERTGDIRLVQQQLGHTTPAITALMYAWHTHTTMLKRVSSMYE